MPIKYPIEKTLIYNGKEITFFCLGKYISLNELLNEYRKRNLEPASIYLLDEAYGDENAPQHFATILNENGTQKGISFDGGYGGIPAGIRITKAEGWNERWYFAGTQ